MLFTFASDAGPRGTAETWSEVKASKGSGSLSLCVERKWAKLTGKKNHGPATRL